MALKKDESAVRSSKLLPEGTLRICFSLNITSEIVVMMHNEQQVELYQK